MAASASNDLITIAANFGGMPPKLSPMVAKIADWAHFLWPGLPLKQFAGCFPVSVLIRAQNMAGGYGKPRNWVCVNRPLYRAKFVPHFGNYFAVVVGDDDGSFVHAGFAKITSESCRGISTRWS